MKADKSAKERAELDQQIERVERLEDEFSEARQRYERSLEQFREQFHAVGRNRESSPGGRAAQQELLLHVDRYVEAATEEAEQTRSRVRQSFDERLEKLAHERNGLPWE